MGISVIPGLFLARHRDVASQARRGIILGRQKMHMKPARMARFLSALADMGLCVTEAEITQPDGFSETFFSRLGYPRIEALDFTDAEGAQHVHDLNRPCPEALRGQFDIVIDGGTTEHIFHIGAALDTCHELLAPGGASCLSWPATAGLATVSFRPAPTCRGDTGTMRAAMRCSKSRSPLVAPPRSATRSQTRPGNRAVGNGR